MRIYLRLSKNQKLVPFNYQELLVGVTHKWIGENNDVHGKSGQYSFSWIQNTFATKDGINLGDDPYFFIGSINDSFVKKTIGGILKNPEMFCGVRVIDVQIRNIPSFRNSEEFFMASPVFLKLREGSETRHVTIRDEDFEKVLTDSFKRKLLKAELPSEGLTISLNPKTSYRQTKLVTYKGIKNKTSLAPIIIHGTQEQIAYAWCNGLGNSTGIGFGALK